MKTVLESGVSSLIESGMYPDKKALFDEALGVLLETKPQLKIEIALRLYRKGEISLSRAAEIAGVSIEGIKNMLSLHGMQRNVKTCTEKEYVAAEKFVRGKGSVSRTQCPGNGKRFVRENTRSFICTKLK